MRHVVTIALVAACGSSQPSDSNTSDLSSDQRLARETIVRDVAARKGLHNGMLIAGLAEAEVHLAHCWSEATWACPGPQSTDCNGPVVAGSADGDCGLQKGGLGMFQFDAGTYTDTLGAHGDKILNVSGSVEEAVDFVVNMVIQSAYTPTSVNDRASALAWLDQVTIDGPTWDVWLKTVVTYYNGCAPNVCSVYDQRRQKYDTAFRTVRDERGAAFWAAAPAAGWVFPLTQTIWQIDFDVVNPSVPGFGSCFGKPLNQLVHSGEDWANAAGTPVRAVGAGTVVYAAFANYPGSVIVIRHDLAEAERAALGVPQPTIYSMYGHLANVAVAAGNQVTAGQHIADILDQSSNSHLHWEIRTVEVPQLCGFNDPGPGYTDAGTDARTWGYLDPTNSVTALASANTTPTTCDNNVPVDATACAHQGDTVEYVCKRPGLPSDQQWDIVSCPAGSTCTGNACSGASTCQSNTTVAACDATNGACAWYACANGCYPWGTDINVVCDCSSKHSIADCDATNGYCAWYACANACYRTGTDINTVCGSSWNCADSSWGTGQIWTCGSDGNRHECTNGSPIVDTCAHGCVQRGSGQDDLCIQSDPSWSCANSSWGSGQLWTCSNGSIHECQAGTGVRVDCPFGCTVMPLGQNDVCN